MNLKNKNILLVGLAKTGVSTIKLLNKLEANIIVNDIKDKEKLKDNEYKVIIQCDKVGLLVSLNFKEEETDYEEVKVDLSNVKKISEFNEDDYTYLIEQIENSDGMKELVNQLLEKYTKVQEEMI